MGTIINLYPIHKYDFDLKGNCYYRKKLVTTNKFVVYSSKSYKDVCYPFDLEATAKQLKRLREIDTLKQAVQIAYKRIKENQELRSYCIYMLRKNSTPVRLMNIFLDADRDNIIITSDQMKIDYDDEIGHPTLFEENIYNSDCRKSNFYFGEILREWLPEYPSEYKMQIQKLSQYKFIKEVRCYNSNPQLSSKNMQDLKDLEECLSVLSEKFYTEKIKTIDLLFYSRIMEDKTYGEYQRTIDEEKCKVFLNAKYNLLYQTIHHEIGHHFYHTIVECNDLLKQKFNKIIEVLKKERTLRNISIYTEGKTRDYLLEPTEIFARIFAAIMIRKHIENLAKISPYRKFRYSVTAHEELIFKNYEIDMILKDFEGLLECYLIEEKKEEKQNIIEKAFPYVAACKETDEVPRPSISNNISKSSKNTLKTLWTKLTSLFKKEAKQTRISLSKTN